MECKSEYTMSGYACIPTERINKRCFLHESSSKCYVCKNNYVEKDGKCFLPDESTDGPGGFNILVTT